MLTSRDWSGGAWGRAGETRFLGYKNAQFECIGQKNFSNDPTERATRLSFKQCL